MTPALEAEALGLRYGRKWALRDCTLSLPAGQVIGLVGPNGAGKTTLLSLAVGLLRPTTGDVRVLGRPPRSPGTIADVGFVAQDKPLYRNLTVAETLRMGAWLNPGWDGRAATDRITRIDIPMEQKVGRLSGGQRSQLALAMALGKRPKLLLLDEPAAGLNGEEVRQLSQIVRSIRDSGVTVVLIEHNMGLVMSLCERVTVLASGRIIADGTPAEVATAPQVIEAYLGDSMSDTLAEAPIEEATR